MRLIMNVLALSCLILFLTACGHNKPLIKEKVIYVHPPKVLLIPTEIPRFNGSSCGDLISDYIPDLKEAIRSCNADKESIQELNNKEEE